MRKNAVICELLRPALFLNTGNNPGKIYICLYGKYAAGSLRVDRGTGRRAAACAVCILLCMTVTGCVTGPKNMQKIRDLEFTVLDREAIPEELELLIEENKDEPFKLTYADQGYLYIAEGYGARLTTGYSVKVNELYEAEDAVCIHTSLLGPEKGEETKEITTFPYVAVQLEYIEKDVVFQ